MPWLTRLNMQCMPEFLREYADQNWIGCPLLAANDPLLLHMMRGMALFAKNVTTMLLEFLILTAVSDILCVFVAIFGNSLSCSPHQLLFNMIVGMMPFL